MAERFAGRIHVLHSKVRILLHDMPTNISLHKHTYNSFVIYLFTVYDLLLLLFTHSSYPANIPYYSLPVFTTTLTEISYIKTKNILNFFVNNLKYFRMNFIQHLF
jgi:hypothetical protein